MLVLSTAAWLSGSNPVWAQAAEADVAQQPDNAQQPGNARPNVVIFLADDQGYGDVGVYGAAGFKTPHLDRLAAEGMRFTDYYVAQAVCSASRTALLTGCYPNRIGILGALGPKANHGIHDDEWTIAELLKQRGYATAIYGKWHLGHLPQFLPARHGFDDYLGLPYSNDMGPVDEARAKQYPALPLIDGVTTLEVNPDQSQLVRRYTERAVAFIMAHQDEPFLLYVPHSMPHVPIFASEKFKGQSAQGTYGDVIQEIDDSVGQVLAALEACQLTDRTMVVYTTDNGPWLNYGNHAGSAAHLREGKGTSFDGGVRVPCLVRWPTVIPAGSICHEPVMNIDWLPTLADLADVALPPHTIDGRSIAPLLRQEPGAQSPHAALYFYWGEELQAIRAGRWKLHFPHAYRTLTGGRVGNDGQAGTYQETQIDLALFDLKTDPGETTNLAAKHPQVVARLEQLADEARMELGDSRTGEKGHGRRPAGKAN